VRPNSKTFEVPLLDIRTEVKCLGEVKDVRDEINMIRNILEHQAHVFDEMITTSKRQLEQGLDETSRREARDMLQQVIFDKTLETLHRRWKALDEDAERVEQSVSPNLKTWRWIFRMYCGFADSESLQLNYLLDLKQKQANLDEAASASEESKTAAVQNQAVLVFTVVTVIFVSQASMLQFASS